MGTLKRILFLLYIAGAAIIAKIIAYNISISHLSCINAGQPFCSFELPTGLILVVLLLIIFSLFLAKESNKMVRFLFALCYIGTALFASNAGKNQGKTDYSETLKHVYEKTADGTSDFCSTENVRKLKLTTKCYRNSVENMVANSSDPNICKEVGEYMNKIDCENALGANNF